MNESERKLRFQGIGALESGQARAFFRPPDLLTALRLPLAAAFLVMDDQIARLGIIVVAGVSDVVDGIWARRLGGSRLGVILDPVCDKIFMAAGFLVVLQSGVLRPLEILGVLVRDILAVLGFLAVAVLKRPMPLPARAGGKAVTFCQLLTLSAFVLESEYVRPLAWATAAISFYALADYSRVVWRKK
ncbi:MAG: CDP-alcohol phosphatidyltransferase family protein [Gemmatimonadetes bacterium]|nr:CDP-alcohol phosphatidyltransferase family protein [Gemmatimonadota bacterium]